MSYNVRFWYKTKDYGWVDEYPEHDCPTYNLRAIFEQSMDWDYEMGVAYDAQFVKDKFERGLAELAEKRDYYKTLEPSNGWGTVDDAIACLMDYWGTILRHERDGKNISELKFSWDFVDGMYSEKYKDWLRSNND